ncbi:uncharacterized protein LOC114516747 [Dendronephthya gigantea]|uniref:uncharacterized protein LOC114516747 n=1 Tax=Dendronephthya gigantea TaxID=151771 RepID=UPI001068E638|nr:uncharacterized protein LOC114516747 [Dendronephthya gigantea]
MQVRKMLRRKKEISQASFNSDVAEGVVDIDKLLCNMETEVDKLKQEFRCCITTRISPAVFDNIKVTTGKRKISLGNIASIQNKDDKYILDLTSSPNMTSPAMKALNENSIFNPLLEGNTITVTVPRLTMEVRKTLVKSAKEVCEEAKIGIRRVRQKGMNDVRKQKKVMSQDDVRMIENYIQSLTDNYVEQVDKMLHEKSEELLHR